MIDKIKTSYFLNVDLNKLNQNIPAAALHTNKIITDDCICFSGQWGGGLNSWQTGIIHSIYHYDSLKIIPNETVEGSFTASDVTKMIRDSMFKIDGSNIQDKALFRYPDLTLPRMKVDLLKEKYNVKIIRDINKSDYQIISDKFIENLFNNGYITLYSNSNVKSWLYNESTFNQKASDKINNFLSNIEADSHVYVKIHADWGSIYKGVEKTLTQKLKTFHNTITYPKIIKDYDALKNILQSKSLIFDKDVIKICGEDSVIIDEDQYNSIYNMLKSDDKENLILALEIMSNCNIDESLDKLTMLYFKFAEKLRYAKNWNTINVKTLRSYFKDVPMKSEHNAHLYQYEKLINFLNENNSVTEFIYKMILQDISKSAFSLIGLTESKVFSFDINSLKLKENYKIKPLQIVADLPF